MKSFLFALLLVCPSNSTPTHASPPRARGQLQSNSGMVTVPLKGHHALPNVDLHPRVLLQQYINHGSRRLARMTGCEEPSEDFLRSELHKTVTLLENGPGPRQCGDVAVVKGSNTGRGYGNTDLATAVVNNGTGTRNVAVIRDTIGSCNDTNTGEAATELRIESYDVGYYFTVQIGTPQQAFTVLIDSDHGDFWVAGENCLSCINHTTLGPKSSNSFKSTISKSFETVYSGLGVVQGWLCQDNVNIAGLELQDYTFGVVTAESGLFTLKTTPFDGVFGLALSASSKEGVPTPVESLAAKKLIQAPITSYKIPRLTDQLNDGEITFGGLDSTKFFENTLVTIRNVNKNGYWEGEMDAVTVNYLGIEVTSRTAIFDTSTTLIIAPLSDAKYVVERLGGSCDMQQCMISCNTPATLSFSFGNRSFAIDPSDLAFLPMDSSDPTGTCLARIQPQNVGGYTTWLVGSTFLKNVYFSTNVETDTMSFAELT